MSDRTKKERCSATNRAWRTLVASLLVLALLPSAQGNDTPEPDVAAKIRSLRASTVSATGITVPKLVTFPTYLREAELPKLGCTFNVTASDQLAQLLDVIEQAEIRGAPPHSNKVDPRFSIVLTAADGSTTRLLFEELIFRDGHVEGSQDGAPVVSNKTLPAALRAWAAKVSPGARTSYASCV